MDALFVAGHLLDREETEEKERDGMSPTCEDIRMRPELTERRHRSKSAEGETPVELGESD